MVRLVRFEVPELISPVNYIEIQFKVFEKITYMITTREHEIFTCIIKLFIHHFDSKTKKECTLFDYHNVDFGRNCQYVGFFADKADPTQIAFYGKNRIPFVINTDFIRGSQFNKSVGIIKSRKTYTKYDKNQYFLVRKLEYAESKTTNYTIDRHGSPSEQEDIIERGSNPVQDEHIIVANAYVPVFSINILDSVKFPDITKKPDDKAKLLYDILTHIFLSDDALENTHIKVLNYDLTHFIERNQNNSKIYDNMMEQINFPVDPSAELSTSGFRQFVELIQYNLMEFAYNDNVKNVDMEDPEIESMDLSEDTYMKKYLKYKKKYVELKRNMLN